MNTYYINVSSQNKINKFCKRLVVINCYEALKGFKLKHIKTEESYWRSMQMTQANAQ